METLTCKIAREILDYDRSTGIFTWKRTIAPRAICGRKAGTINRLGYVVITINRKLYGAHRLAWLLSYGGFPDGDIDHRNGNRHDNRLSNLRVATDSQTQLNTKVSRNNRCGIKNVSWNKSKERWLVSLYKDGRFVFRKHFLNLTDAEKCAARMRLKYHGEFALENRLSA